jgi:acetyltransferase-like isoleucine patch superfamily enzyme
MRIIESFLGKYVKGILLNEYLVFGDKTRLAIADTAVVNNALFNLLSGKITIEDYVFFGHNVSILTGKHDIHKFGRDRQLAVSQSGHDVLIRKGAWLASNVTVLGPSIIGENAVVAACSLVIGDVPPFSVVAGTPARVVKTIEAV